MLHHRCLPEELVVDWSGDLHPRLYNVAVRLFRDHHVRQFNHSTISRVLFGVQMAGKIIVRLLHPLVNPFCNLNVSTRRVTIPFPPLLGKVPSFPHTSSGRSKERSGHCAKSTWTPGKLRLLAQEPGGLSTPSSLPWLLSLLLLTEIIREHFPDTQGFKRLYYCMQIRRLHSGLECARLPCLHVPCVKCGPGAGCQNTATRIPWSWR
jgi:hypothetical protein